MRTNFYELLAQKEFDIRKEYYALWSLFVEEDRIWYQGSLYSLMEFVDRQYFRELPFRGSFTSISGMMSALGIVSCPQISIERLFVFSEFLIAVLSNIDSNEIPSLGKQKKTIMGNIKYILERTNHEIRRDGENHRIIVEKNKMTTLAAEVVTEPAIAFELIEYNHFAIKGHLDEKRKLLASIANYIEPILRSKVLQKAGYQSLQSDAGFVFNNFHIRHNNKEGAKKQDYIASLNDGELEEWYDKAYEIALSVIIINDYLTIGSEIADLKTKHTWRT